MSYRDFDRGLTAEEVRAKNGRRTNHTQERFNKWAESEHVLNVLRSIKAWNQELDEEMMKRWEAATRHR